MNLQQSTITNRNGAEQRMREFIKRIKGNRTPEQIIDVVLKVAEIPDPAIQCLVGECVALGVLNALEQLEKDEQRKEDEMLSVVA